MRIPCELAEDLIPLIKDGIASQASSEIVNEHISECQACKKLFEEQGYLYRKANSPQLRKLKWVLFAVFALLFTIGGLLEHFSSSVKTPMPIALVVVGVLAMIPLAKIIGKGKPDSMNRFFYGKAIVTVILFALIGLYLLLRYVFRLF